jgi:protein-tyrosine kinase
MGALLPEAAVPADSNGEETFIEPVAPPPDHPPVAPLPPASEIEPVRKTGAPQTRPIEAAVLERIGVIGVGNARSRIAEEFRIIQGEILRNAFAPTATAGVANLVMITSAKPNEGKSFSTVNLAASIARQRDREVILVDLDTKHGSLTDLLGFRSAPGLLDLLSKPSLDVRDLLMPTDVDRLFFLPTGTHAEAAEVFASRAMSNVIRALGRRYPERIILFDSPPCLSTSDPSALSRVVGQTVLVVEAHSTQRADVEAAVEMLQACPRIALMLNKAQMSVGNYFGAYTS